MELSVIIVSYNVRYFLEQCLRSVRNASENIDCEIFVVDNNSADGSCSMVSTEFPEVRLIMNNDNRGFSAANNQALKLAAGRFILLLNPDTIVEENTFKKCITFMDSHPDAGAAGVRMINGKGRLLPESKRSLPTPKTAFFKIVGLSFIFPKSRLFNSYYLGHLDDLQTSQADIISGAFMFLRGEAVSRTGLFDEDYFMYGEDIDYSYRLKKAGFNNYYYPEIKIIHYKGESAKKENLNVLINFYKAMRIFVRKHYTDGSLKPFVFLIQVAIFLRAGVSLLNRFIKRIFLPPFRFLISLILPEIADNPFSKSRRTVIVSDPEGYARVKDLILSAGDRNIIAGRVSIRKDDMKEEVLGNIDQIREVLRINRIKEVIFTTRGLNAAQIIDSMHLISDFNIHIKIASSGEKFILGSRYVNPKDGIVPLKRPLNKRNILSRLKNFFR
jgi:GT2 family glycosyltransferase